MNRKQLVSSLGTLVDLREREVDRLASDMARKTQVRERFQKNLARMTALCSAESSQCSLPMALSLNRAGYKQALLCMMDEHRQDLRLHEADMAVTQRALAAASRQREVLDQVRANQRGRLLAEQAQREQKGQDELASQVWWRSRP